MSPRIMRRVRQLHHYVGLFLAPAILLFSVSGALQTFRLQDAKDAPAWVAWLATVHKDQLLPSDKPRKPDHGPRTGDKSAPAKHAPKQPSGRKHSALPLKIFVLLLSVGLILSTLLGIAISLNNRSTRRTSLLLLATGTILPLALLIL